MHISNLAFAVANLIVVNAQAPDSAELSSAIVRETLGYASRYAVRAGVGGPILIDSESFGSAFNGAHLTLPSEAKYQSLIVGRTAKTAAKSNALVRNGRGHPVSVAENGLFVQLESVTRVGDSARARFILGITLEPPTGVKGYPSRVGFDLFELVFARSSGKWTLARTTHIGGS